MVIHSPITQSWAVILFSKFSCCNHWASLESHGSFWVMSLGLIHHESTEKLQELKSKLSSSSSYSMVQTIQLRQQSQSFKKNKNKTHPCTFLILPMFLWHLQLCLANIWQLHSWELGEFKLWPLHICKADALNLMNPVTSTFASSRSGLPGSESME